MQGALRPALTTFLVYAKKQRRRAISSPFDAAKRSDILGVASGASWLLAGDFYAPEQRRRGAVGCVNPFAFSRRRLCYSGPPVWHVIRRRGGNDERWGPCIATVRGAVGGLPSRLFQYRRSSCRAKAGLLRRTKNEDGNWEAAPSQPPFNFPGGVFFRSLSTGPDRFNTQKQ